MRDYSEQADLLANMLRDATLYELLNASQNGGIKHINPESIRDIGEIVYQYYKEFNKNNSGGVISASINSVLEDSLREYSRVKQEKLENTRDDGEVNFANNVSNIDLKLEGCSLEDLLGYDFLYNNPIIEKPIFQFFWIGNSGAFSMARKNKDGTPICVQFMDDDGNILPKPIRTRYEHGEWVPADVLGPGSEKIDLDEL